MTVSTTTLIRVMIVDDHAIVRAGLRMLIESRPGLSIVAEAERSSEVLNLAELTQPDIILLDLDLGGNNGLDLIPELIGRAPQARLILLTGIRDESVHRHGVRMGAMGLVPKEHAPEMLLKAIEKVHEGEVWLDRSMTANVLADLARARELQEVSSEEAKIASLTERELEVIGLIAEGLPNKEIADRLSISDSTVRHHLTSIYSKLEAPGRLELVIYAFRHGLADLPR